MEGCDEPRRFLEPPLRDQQECGSHHRRLGRHRRIVGLRVRTWHEVHEALHGDREITGRRRHPGGSLRSSAKEPIPEEATDEDEQRTANDETNDEVPAMPASLRRRDLRRAVLGSSLR